MTVCPVCQTETAPVKIGGLAYCSQCGKALAGDAVPAAAGPAGPKRVSLDLTPRSHGNAVHRREAAASGQPAPGSVAPHLSGQPGIAPHQSAHSAQSAPSAQAVHRRAKPSRTLDLRNATTPEPAPATIHHTPHTPAAPPKSTTHERHLAHFTDRFERARQVERSQHIQKFNNNQRHLNGPWVESTTPQPAYEHHQTGPHPHGATFSAAPATGHAPAHTQALAPARELPPHVAARHEAMTRLATTAPTPATPTAPAQPARRPTGISGARPNLRLSPGSSKALATISAVALMGSYIWLQNYPKLALQSANSKAGLSASLPGYLPSSYSLAKTDASPGLITLNFNSPSATEPLKIAQHRTSWDTNSLVDNYVAKHTDDYATVQGQGLTIYLFNSSQATWVNHGIWYSIEGASRLSREQILKIAYSL